MPRFAALVHFASDSYALFYVEILESPKQAVGCALIPGGDDAKTVEHTPRNRKWIVTGYLKKLWIYNL
jgi:hypothetical protein